MPKVHVRQKHQITLPSSIVQKAHIAPNDTLEIALVNGVITLTPTKRRERKDSVMSYAGVFRGAWGATPKELEKRFVINAIHGKDRSPSCPYGRPACLF